MTKKFGSGSLVLVLLSPPAFALYDREKDPYYKEALSEAKTVFSTFVVQCDGKTYAKIHDKAFVEFSQPLKEVRMFGAYGVSEGDRLNGKKWAGKFEAILGQSARLIVTDQMGNVVIRDWQDTREAEFDLVLNKDVWQAEGAVNLYIDNWYEIVPDFTCSSIPI